MVQHRKLSIENFEARYLLASAATEAEESVPSEWIVRVADHGSTPAAQQLDLQRQFDQSNDVDFRVLRRVSGNNQFLVSANAEDSESVVGFLQSVRGVVGIEPNQVAFATAIEPPSDPRFGDQYALQNTGQDSGVPGADIGALDAWEVAIAKTGSVGSRSMVTAVVDSGIDYDHPDLYLNIWINQGEIPPAIRDQLIDVDNDGLYSFVDLNDSRNALWVTDRPGDDNDFIDAGDLFADPAWMNQVDDDAFSAQQCDSSNQRCEFVDDLFGWDFLEDDNNPFYINDQVVGGNGVPVVNSGHGTHVAGTIAAIGNGADRSSSDAEHGIAGLNWTTSVLPIRILDANNRGTLADAIEALAYLNVMQRSEHADIRVVNNSWGLRDFSRALEDQVDKSEPLGMLLIAAAGNGNFFGDGLSIDRSPVFPAAYDNPHIISVAASDRFNELARFSNFSKGSVDLAAPGVRVLSTEPAGEYGFRSGTSMAAPHVAGTAALLWTTVPEATNLEIRAAILDTVDELSSLVDVVVTGGRLNAGDALIVDHFSPVAQIVQADDVTQGSSAYEVVIHYQDTSALNPNSFGNENIRVRRTGSDDDSLPVELVGIAGDTADERQRTASYRVTPPGGTWDAFDSGEYEILLGQAANTVSDAIGNFASEGRPASLGTFSVRLDVVPVGEIFNVDIQTDSIDKNPGDGLCLDESDKCSLRAAVMEANELPGVQTIRLGAGSFTLSIIGDVFSGDDGGNLDIEEELVVIGAGQQLTEIDAQNLMEVFFTRESAKNLTLADLSIVNAFNDFLGGSAIEIDSDLSLLRTEFRRNSTQPDAELTSAIDGFNGDVERLFSSSGTGVMASGAEGTGYLMFSEDLISQRFEFEHSHSKVVAVQFREDNWFVFSGVDSLPWVPFAPMTNDRLLASVDFSIPSLDIVPLIGQSGSVEGIELGYVEGDVRFSANQFDGQTSDGDIDVSGDFFSISEMAELRIVDSLFSGNGGNAVIDVWGYRVNIENSLIIDNVNPGNDAAVTVQGSYLNVSNTVFENNSGGAVELNSVVAEFLSVDFVGNRSEGAMYVRNTNLKINNGQFIDNHSASHGGAIYSDSSSIVIEDSIFAGNSAQDENNSLGSGLGGAVFLDSEEYLDGVRISNSTFTGNTAESGAAIFLGFDTTSTRIENVEIIDNHAVGGSAGGIYVNGEVTLIDSRILNNVADDGGGLWGHSGPDQIDRLIIQNSTVVNNVGAAGPSNIAKSLDVVSLGNNVIGVSDNTRFGRLSSAGTRLSGRVFNDLNNNARIDDNEPPIVGVTVYLDANQNGTLDSGEPIALSDLSGTYAFSNLESGRQYVLAVDGVPDFNQTLPDPNDQSVPISIRGKRQVALGENDSIANQDFGFHSVVTGQSGAGVVFGRVFEDGNGNGSYDLGESGRAGVRVFIDDLFPNGTYDDGELFTRTLEANPSEGILEGDYQFNDVPPGNVRLVVETPESKTSSSPNSNALRLNSQFDTFGFRDPQDVVNGNFGGDGEGYVVSDRDANRNNVVLLKRDGNGGFVREILPGNYKTPGAITKANLNGDKISDVIISNEGSRSVSFLESQLDGTFSSHSIDVGYLQTFVSAHDVNSDELDDAFVARKKGRSPGKDPTVEYFTNLGNGQFGPAVALPDLPLDVPAHILHADVLGGDEKEVIMTGWNVSDDEALPSRHLAIYEFVGGTYELRSTFQLPAATNPLFTTVGDFNADDSLDLAIADPEDRVYILLNDPAQQGVFCATESCTQLEVQIVKSVQAPTSLVTSDVDDDGDQDLIAAHQDDAGGRLAVLRNLGEGTFDSTATTFGATPFDGIENLTRSFVAINDDNGQPVEFLVPQDGTLSSLGNSVDSGVYRFTLRDGQPIRNRDFGLIDEVVDSNPPTSSVAPLPVAVETQQFTVQWSGDDGAEGTGVVAYDIFVSTDGGAYQKVLSETSETSFEFSGQTGSTYGFYSIARDAAGNVESAPVQADATTEVVQSPWNNPANTFDVDNRSGTAALDALVIINELARRSVSDRDTEELVTPPPAGFAPPYFDVNVDGRVSALDALQVINELQRLSGLESTADAELVFDVPVVASRNHGESTREDELFDSHLPTQTPKVCIVIVNDQEPESVSEESKMGSALVYGPRLPEQSSQSLDETISVLADDFNSHRRQVRQGL